MTRPDRDASSGVFMARILASLLAALATTLCLVPLGIGETPFPDVVLVNGRLFTGDGSRPYVEALAIRGDRIVAVGTSANIGSLAGPMTTRIDVGGRVVIPGFNDACYHRALTGRCGTAAAPG